MQTQTVTSAPRGIFEEPFEDLGFHVIRDPFSGIDNGDFNSSVAVVPGTHDDLHIRTPEGFAMIL